MKIKLAVLTFIKFFTLCFLTSYSQDMGTPNILLPYREYVIEMKDGNEWRVTDPNSPYDGNAADQPEDFLPNPVFDIPDIDLKYSAKAEVIIDRWGGHTGTIGHQIRFNDNSWIDLPILLEGTPTNPAWYNFQDNPRVEVPLKYLKEGTNQVEGTSGPQTKFAGAWGQWGWYSLILRIYYCEKIEATAQYTNVQDNGTLTDNPEISISVTNPDEVERIVVRGIYEGPDENGDGEYYDLHGMYHYAKLQGIIGEVDHQPFTVTWDTEWIPDQTKDIQLIAQVKLKNGYWFFANTLNGIKMKKNNFSVKMYPAENVPEKFWVRNNKKASCSFTIPESQSLAKAVEVRMFIRTWNGNNNEEKGTPFKINESDWILAGGGNHNFDFRMVVIPVELIKNGQNTITFTSSTLHHGCEILWPGPTILIKYTD